MTRPYRTSHCWNDVIPAATITRIGPTAADYKAYGTTGFFFPAFTDNHAQDEIFQSGFQVTHQYMPGTDGHFHIHIIPSANGAGGNEDVVLKFDYQWVNIGAAFNTTTNSSETLTFRVGAAEGNKHILWEWSAMTGTGKTFSSAVPVLITRLSKTSAADNYTGDIFMLFNDIHIENDRNGSIGETSD